MKSDALTRPRVLLFVAIAWALVVLGVSAGKFFRETQVREQQGVVTDPAGRFRMSSPLVREGGSLTVEGSTL